MYNKYSKGEFIMKKTSKISLVIVLVIFQLFTLSVKGYGKEESDVTYEDVFKLSDENKMSLLEPDLVKFITNMDLRDLNKNCNSNYYYSKR